MDCQQENTENVAIFWKLVNECLAVVSGGKITKFDPDGFCFDMAGCNREAGVFVFGGKLSF